MLAVQSCADIASHIASDEGWPAAATLVAGLRRLGEHHVVSEQTVEALSRAVGLRNVVAHGYGGVDAPLVFAAATSGVADLERFSREVAEWTATRESAG
jgi:uncharacterized protein YutE (UPF0331/DUF86 family)